MAERFGNQRLLKHFRGWSLRERFEGLTLNLVLLGKIGAGKSASGNTILGREAFTSKKSFSSVTQDLAFESGTVGGRRVTVYDTPGLFNTKLSEEEIQQIYANVLQRCESGLCVFLLVIKADRFTRKERKTVEKIEELLGEERLKKTWILFTRGDQLEEENKSIDEFINETEPLMRLVQKYDQRYHVFNNKTREPNGQVQELLTKIYSTYPDTIEKVAKPKQDRWVETRGKPKCFHVSSLSSQLLFDPVEESSNEDETSCEYEYSSEDETSSEDEIRILHPSASPLVHFLGSTEKVAKPKQDRWVETRGKPKCFHVSSLSSQLLFDPVEESSSEDEITIPNPFAGVSASSVHFLGSSDSLGYYKITQGRFSVGSEAWDDTSRRIVLLGQTGAGRSAAGNTIMGQKEFDSVMSTRSVTRECSVKHGTVSGRTVSVVDTPGLYHTEMKPEEIKKEIMRSVYISSPGPHAFLIVFRVDVRFTEQELQIPQMIEMMFGEEVLKYSIILFTHGDLLRGKSVKKLIKENSRLRDVVGQCGGRFHVFNNRDENNRDQVNDLLQKIDTMIEKNGGGHYSNQMYEDAQRFRREEEKRIRAEIKGLPRVIQDRKIKSRRLRDSLQEVFFS